MRFMYLVLTALIPLGLFAQKYTISGTISDSDTGEKLIGANIVNLNTGEGTTSNTYGFFSLTLERDSIDLLISYIGYGNYTARIALDRNITLDIELSSSVDLDVVEVVADKVTKIQDRTQMSTIEVPIVQIKKIPALLGEVDVLKALQLLPGVQSGGEGQSGLYVRGGSPDQNLILLDGVPVYNASHLFGFFSVFNADAIRDVKLIKGGFPARYGGRLSSVLEINMKEGNTKKLHGSATIGLVASKLTLEGPIDDKTSFLISGRRTYVDVLMKPIVAKQFSTDNQKGGLGYFFYDLNAKINHRISERDQLFLSAYFGDDQFYFNSRDLGGEVQNYFNNKFGWGNLTGALRWNRIWHPKLFSNTTLTFSRYKLNFGSESGSRYGESSKLRDNILLDYVSGIEDFAAKIDFDFLPNPKHFIKFGTSIIHHRFMPGIFDLEQNDTERDYQFKERKGQEEVVAQELGLYIEDEMQLGDALNLNAGVHLSGFAVQDRFYHALQPRIGLRYLLPSDLAIKASFSQMRQYIQLLAYEGIGLPTDLWLPTTKRVKPQDAWQVALGVAKNVFQDRFELSIEAYYKQMTNVISYKEGEGVFALTDWQDRVTQGLGWAYGAELFFQKKKGAFTGWLGYTLSWSTRQFDDLNFGNTFNFRYDRRHDISLVGSYTLNENIDLSASWVYGTGNAISLGNSKYLGSYGYGIATIPFNGTYYTERNNYRMRAYHRLDFGANFKKQKKYWKRTWSVGAYNAYSRKNPFYIYQETNFTTDPDTGISEETVSFKQASLFPIIPYVSYKIDF